MIDPPPISGIILIDKPLGPTSMDVCRAVRRRLIAGGAPKRVKVGHGGTLDPLATGLLVVLIGRATKLCDKVMAGAKVYLAEVDLSAGTSTDDAEGERIEQACGVTAEGGTPRPVLLSDIEEVLARFVGTIQQRPPAFSAMKVGGQRAYKLARQGREVKLAPRPVRIDGIRTIGYAWPRLKLEIECGKGTYIRSLARDLGAALGWGGHLAALRRTRIGRFAVEQARPLDALPGTLTQLDLLEPTVE